MTKTTNSFLEYSMFVLLIAFALILSFGKNFSSAVMDGINLWVVCVLPSLLPYFFITAILSSLGATSKICSKLSPITTRVFRINGSVGYALFMSLISGYPMGAKIVSDLKDGGLLTREESVRACALCSNSSPMFLIASVGSLMFNSATFGLTLLGCHLLAVFTVGIIFSFYKRKTPITNNNKPFIPQKMDDILYESAYSAVISSLVVGGIITIFYLVTEILLTYHVLDPFINGLGFIFGDTKTSQGIILGLFEYTRGLKSIATGGITSITLPACAFLAGFGGLSVIMQSVAYLKKAKIKTAPFFLSKVLCAVLGLFYAFLFALIF